MLTSGLFQLKFFFNKKELESLWVEALVLGFFSFYLIFGILLHFKLNYNILYFLILIIPILFIKKLINFNILKSNFENLKTFISSLNFELYVFSFFILSYVLSFAFFPTVDWDDNVVHLGMWTKIKFLHFYPFDVKSQIWAAEPFLVDLTHAVISVLSGNDSRGALNFSFAIFIFLLMYKISFLFNNNKNYILLNITLFFSTPIISFLLTTLQTELFDSLLTLMGIYVLFQKEEKIFFHEKLIFLILIFSMLIGSKLSAGLIGFLLIISWLIISFKKIKNHFFSNILNVRNFMFLLFAVVVGSQSYVISYALTGNPFLPFFNEYFKSIFYDNNPFLDRRWFTGANINSFVGFFLKTSQHMESLNFVAGFQYLFLLPISLILLFLSKNKKNYFLILLIVFGYGIPMFIALQYWRYFFGILPLISIFFMILFNNLNSKNYIKKFNLNLINFSFVFIASINILFLPGVAWYFNQSPLSLIRKKDKLNLIFKDAPERIINSRINKNNSILNVIYLEGQPYGATLKGVPYYINWYSKINSDSLNKIKSENEIKRFILEQNISFIYIDLSLKNRKKGNIDKLFENYIKKYGVYCYKVGTIVAFKVNGNYFCDSRLSRAH